MSRSASSPSIPFTPRVKSSVLLKRYEGSRE